MANLRERLWRRIENHRLAGPWLAASRLRTTQRFLAALAPATIIAPARFPRVDGATLTTHGETFLLEEPPAVDAIVLRLDRLNEVDPRLSAQLETGYTAVFLNRSYAIFARSSGLPGRRHEPAAALMARLRQFAPFDRRGLAPHRPAEARAQSTTAEARRRTCFVTTMNRPAALSRSLPQICALGLPTLVVDDGSEPDLRAANQSIAARHGALYVCLPENRGLPAAMNAGLAYWLADPGVSWISYFQDDIDVSPETMRSLEALEDAVERPLITGFDAPEHPVVDAAEEGGVRFVRKRSSPAVHLHGHAGYWAKVLPIPSPYLGAPKPRIGASLEDWWIVSDAPHSVGKTGKLIACLPGLVTTFLHHRDDSSWDNPSEI